LGDGGNKILLRRQRVFSNFSEYAPLGLLLLALVELQSGFFVWVHVLGGLLLAGRIIHAYGVGQEEEDYRFRVFGMMLTLASIGLSAVSNIILSVLT